MLWFAAAGLLAAVVVRIGQLTPESAWLFPIQFAAGAGLCLLSAEHAKRLLEKGRRRDSAVISSTVSCTGGSGRSVDVLISLRVCPSPEELWQQIRDLPRFLTIDPFHDEVTLMRDEAAKGVDLVLSHNAFGRRFLRFGRIVAWKEGVGYTFSDLSRRGPRVGFPHVFIVAIEPLANEPPGLSRRPTIRKSGVGLRGKPGGALGATEGASLSRLTIRVRGRWTSRIVPVWLGRLWIRLVCREHARLLRKGL